MLQGIQFVSKEEIDKRKEAALVAEKRKEQRGDTRWMNPALDQKIASGSKRDKDGGGKKHKKEKHKKKEKKSKSHKHKKDKHKESSSDSEAESRASQQAAPAALVRDSWMTTPQERPQVEQQEAAPREENEEETKKKQKLDEIERKVRAHFNTMQTRN